MAYQPLQIIECQIHFLHIYQIYMIWFVGFYGILTIAGYLIAKSSLDIYIKYKKNTPLPL